MSSTGADPIGPPGTAAGTGRFGPAAGTGRLGPVAGTTDVWAQMRDMMGPIRRSEPYRRLRANPVCRRVIDSAEDTLRRHQAGLGWLPAPRWWSPPRFRPRRLADLPARRRVELAYDAVLHRPADPAGMSSYLRLARSGRLSPYQLVEWLTMSSEWRFAVTMTELNPSLHFSRCEFIQSLPPAGRILDLGGTAVGIQDGALVSMGYPYEFDQLTVIDLPPEDRDQLYRDSETRHNTVRTRLGPVTYRYHSMTDLSALEPGSFDLVYSGQSIEHVTMREADDVLAEVVRLLRPGGHLALDTPNARVTRLQQPDFIDPDHDYEYTHPEMMAKFAAVGLEVVEAKGLNYAGRCLEAGRFSVEEVATRRGMFAKIEDCYLLAYLCRKPVG